LYWYLLLSSNVQKKNENFVWNRSSGTGSALRSGPSGPKIRAIGDCCKSIESNVVGKWILSGRLEPVFISGTVRTDIILSRTKIII